DGAQGNEAKVKSSESVHRLRAPARIERKRTARRHLIHQPVRDRPHQAQHKVSRNAGTKHLYGDDGRAQSESQQIRDHKRQQQECADEKNGGVNQVRPKLVNPSRRDSWNREHDCNGECATANTAASRTNENKADRMRWPPSSSSTKGAEIKRTATAMRSCTVEKHRNPSRSSIG